MLIDAIEKGGAPTQDGRRRVLNLANILGVERQEDISNGTLNRTQTSRAQSLNDLHVDAVC